MNLHMVLWINSWDKQQLLPVEGCLINVKRFFRCATMIHINFSWTIKTAVQTLQGVIPASPPDITYISEWAQGKAALPRKPQIAQMKHITMGTKNDAIMEKFRRWNIWTISKSKVLLRYNFWTCFGVFLPSFCISVVIIRPVWHPFQVSLGNKMMYVVWNTKQLQWSRN